MLRRSNWLCILLWIAIVALGADRADAQGGITETAPWVLTDVNLNTVQVYQIVINAKGSLWDPSAPAFGINESLTIGPFGLPKRRLGGFFEVCVIACAEFGAAVDYGLGASGALSMRADATLGTVRVSYPMRVVIEYPYWKNLKAGDKITIRTSFVPDRGVWMTSSDARFFAELRARGDFFAGLNARARILSQDLPPGGFPAPAAEVHVDEPLFDTNQVFKGPNWESFTIGPVSGRARLPNLGTDGYFGDPNDARALVSQRTDKFLEAGVNFTNLISKAGFGIPLSDKKSFPPFSAEYHILEVAPSLAASAEQRLRFVAEPQITFIIVNQGIEARVKRNAGQSLELTMPLDGSSLEITPVIDPSPHLFSNDTVLFASAETVVDPFRIAAGVDSVEFAGISVDFPRFSINPFDGPRHIPLSPRLDLVSFGRDFSLTDVDAPLVTGSRVVLSTDTSTPRLVSVCGTLDELNRETETCVKLLRLRSSDRLMFLLGAGGVRDDTMLLVNGELMTRSPFGKGADPCGLMGSGAALGIGQACFVLPGHLQAQPGTLRVQLQNPSIGLPRPEHFSNTIDIHVVPESLREDQVGFTSVSQIPGVGTVDDLCKDCDPVFFPDPPVAGLGLMVISHRTARIESRGVPVQFVAPGSTLALDGLPIETTVNADTTMTMDGTTPVFSTAYLLAGFVPAGFQTGGERRLSLIHAGINSPETLLPPITVMNPVPSLESLLTNAGSPSDPAGIRLLVNGANFTPSSIVEWDGAARPAVFVSPGVLILALLPGDLSVGDHTARVVNAAPGGGASNALAYRVPDPGTPAILVKASLTRDRTGRLTAVISFNNTGTGALRDFSVQTVKLHVGKSGHSIKAPLPEAIPVTAPGEANSVMGTFPDVGLPGATASIRIRGQIGGKTVTFEVAVRIP